MKICYFDAFSGIAGDMTVGALIDAGAAFEPLAGALDSLGMGAAFRIEKVKRGGIAATRFVVEGGEQRAHRHLPHILRMIDAGALPDQVKENATAIFRKLGEAEARVHGVPVEKVHFHEVGAVDSIADIAGAAMGLFLLGVDQVHASPVNVGGGAVTTEHGLLPVPAPATVALLEGRPVFSRGPQTELTTPTGAAILATLAVSFGPLPPMRISGAGFGAGTKEFKDQANVLRVILGEASGAAEAVSVAVLEANIDDSTPETLGYAMERLLEAGALDVTLTPVHMKKNRPGVMLTVLARPEDRERLAALVFAETSTLGLRIHMAERRVEARSVVEVETRFGKLRVKVSASGAFAPEYEDCRKLARESGAPLREIMNEAGLAYLRNSR
ncbi:MAG: nickel pincer cofactor biosynthesis protein LarC [Bryobacterales bacterium]|nr:nickel pincer cofactor biosynthesis protein LarC [Bryobacterales bacterium]